MNEKIITNQMLRDQDAKRIAELEAERDALKALLREMYDNWRDDGTYRIGQHIEQISAALAAKEEK